MKSWLERLILVRRKSVVMVSAREPDWRDVISQLERDDRGDEPTVEFDTGRAVTAELEARRDESN